MTRDTQPDARQPLRPVVFSILLVLNERDQHGYGVMKDVNTHLDRRAITGPGTLYRTLKELRDSGLVEHTDAPPGQDARRQYYRLTEAGRQAAEAEARRMAELVSIARAGRLIPDPGSGA